MGIDEADLYPPDVEELTPELRQQRFRAIAGVALVGIGCGLILERTLGTDLDYFWLCIAIGLLAGWARVPRFPMFAVGSIMAGFAAGDFVASLLHVPFETPINLLFDAVGFLAVYVRYPHRARWALIPTAIFGALTVGSIGVELIGFIPGSVTGLLLPVLLIAGGAVLLARHSLPTPVVKPCLGIIALAFILSAASSIDGWDGPDIDFGERIAHESLDIDEDDGPATVSLTTQSEAIVVKQVDDPDDAYVRAIAHGHAHLDIDVEDDDNHFMIEEDGKRWFGSDGAIATWIIGVPAGTNLDLETLTGPITLRVTGGDVDVNTGSGAIQVSLSGDEGSLNVNTLTGAVVISEIVDREGGGLTVNADLSTQSGIVTVDGERVDSPYDETHGDGGADVEVRTGSGAILLSTRRS